MRGKKKNKVAKTVFLYLVGFVCIFPAFVVLMRSFMSPQELSGVFHLIPEKWTLVNYDILLLTNPDFYRHFWNSVLYTAGILLLGLPVALLAGYAFGCRKFRRKSFLFLGYIVIMLVPFQAMLVPQYLMLSHMGILDTPWSIILPNIFATMGTILMAQFMEGIDPCLYEAGRLDGLGHFTVLVKLVIPLCRPAILSYLVLMFLECWAMIEQPMVFLKNSDWYPLALEMQSYDVSSLLPGSVVFSILPLLIFGFGNRSLVDGIRLGVLK